MDQEWGTKQGTYEGARFPLCTLSDYQTDDLTDRQDLLYHGRLPREQPWPFAPLGHWAARVDFGLWMTLGIRNFDLVQNQRAKKRLKRLKVIVTQTSGFVPKFGQIISHLMGIQPTRR